MKAETTHSSVRDALPDADSLPSDCLTLGCLLGAEAFGHGEASIDPGERRNASFESHIDALALGVDFCAGLC